MSKIFECTLEERFKALNILIPPLPAELDEQPCILNREEIANHIAFCENLLIQFGLDPRRDNETTFLGKCEDESEKYREMGNQRLKSKDYKAAIELFNKSIAYSPSESEKLGLCYGCRASVYYIWKRYDYCLMDIEMAKRVGYPVRLINNLLKKEAVCRRVINENEAKRKKFEDAEKSKDQKTPKPKSKKTKSEDNDDGFGPTTPHTKKSSAKKKNVQGQNVSKFSMPSTSGELSKSAKKKLEKNASKESPAESDKKKFDKKGFKKSPVESVKKKLDKKSSKKCEDDFGPTTADTKKSVGKKKNVQRQNALKISVPSTSGELSKSVKKKLETNPSVESDKKHLDKKGFKESPVEYDQKKSTKKGPKEFRVESIEEKIGKMELKESLTINVDTDFTKNLQPSTSKESQSSIRSESAGLKKRIQNTRSTESPPASTANDTRSSVGLQKKHSKESPSEKQEEIALEKAESTNLPPAKISKKKAKKLKNEPLSTFDSKPSPTTLSPSDHTHIDKTPEYTAKQASEELFTEKAKELLQFAPIAAVKSHSAVEEPYQPQLSYPPHQAIPFLANTLEYNYDYEFGRHMRANQYIGAGQILCIERENVSVLLAEYKYLRCANCYRENMFYLIACDFCVSTMYCSKKCLDDGWTKFHQYECKIIDILMRYDEFHLVFRCITHGLQSFGSVAAYKQFVDSVDTLNYNGFSDEVNWKNTPENQLAKLIYTMDTVPEQRTVFDKCHIGRYAAFLTLAIKRFSPCLMNIFSSELDFLSQLSLHYFEVQTINLRLLQNNSCHTSDEGMATMERYGIILTPVTSLINHSCDPNAKIFAHMYDGTILCSVRPIHRGEQILVDYMEGIIPNRKNLISNRYFYECPCDEYHTFYQGNSCLPTFDIYMYLDAGRVMRLYEYDLQYIENSKRKLAKYINETDDYHPCYELYTHRQGLVKCFMRQFGVPVEIIYDPV